VGFKCSIVVPCFNEQGTLHRSVSRLVAAFADDAEVGLEVIIVDDCSTDGSLAIAHALGASHANVRVLHHERNRGKGAALRSGFAVASGDFVGIHDADLEYDPADLRRLLVPLLRGDADVVYGSRFLTSHAHRVLYFWHSLGNRLLTLLSNMFTDLDLSDMETCYKVFRRDVLERVRIDEDRFGFEPEITAKVAALRVRVFEVGIGYYARTYEEGKKIGFKDALRALYCIVRYNGHQAPVGMQFLVYAVIGGVAALANLCAYLPLRAAGAGIEVSAGVAFALAAALNYVLCIRLLFRHQARWRTPMELVVYWLVVGAVGVVDVAITRALVEGGLADAWAKVLASSAGLLLNFAGRRWAVFPESGRGPWRPQSGGPAPS
jgi:glycosyltransferase involved in cell wall biosynthesis